MHESPIAPSPAKLSDSRAIALFLDMLAAERGAATNTLLAYRRDLEGASALAGHQLVTLVDLQPLFTGWRDLAPSSMQRKRSALRRFYAFLVAEGIRPDNPALLVPAASGYRPLPKSLSLAETDRLLQTVAAEAGEGRPGAIRLRALMELLYGSGLRATELVSLPRNAIRPPQPFAIIRGKGEKERLIPISGAALEAVAAQLAHVPEGGPWLFPSRGGHISRIRLYQLVKEVAGRAGINPRNISPHVLRHAFATHMLARGADLRSLQTLLGHADIATTEIYTHVDSSRLLDTVTQLHPLADAQPE